MERVTNFDINPQKPGSLIRNETFMTNSCLPDPKLYPHPRNFSHLNKNKNVHIMTSCSKNDCSNPMANQFTLNFPTMCPKGIKEKSEILEI